MENKFNTYGLASKHPIFRYFGCKQYTLSNALKIINMTQSHSNKQRKQHIWKNDIADVVLCQWDEGIYIVKRNGRIAAHN